MKPRNNFFFDGLAFSSVRWILRNPVFPVLLQAMALAAVLVLAFNGLSIGTDRTQDEIMTLRKTNLTTLFVWGLWWPGLIAVTLVFGRLWCTVCPMEMVNRFADICAGRLGLPRIRLGKFLSAGWMIVVIYLLLQLLVAGLSIHRVPHYTAIFLFVLIGGSLVSGLVFRDPRSFCRAFCPAGTLLSVYGRYTPVQLDACDPAVCGACKSRDCVRPENRARFDKRSCPSLLTPFRRQSSDGCVLCLQCAKVCPYDNIGFGWVAPSAPIRQPSLLNPVEAIFILIALGFVAHEVIGEVKWFDAIFHAIPTSINAWFPSVSFGWFEALWFLVLFPVMMFWIIALISRIFGYRGRIGSLFLAAATGAAPVVAIAHLAKAVAKMSAWGGYLPQAIRDPQGMETLRAILSKSTPSPAGLLGLSCVGWIMLALILLMAWKSWKWSRQASVEATGAALAGLVSSAVLFTTVLVIWVWPTR